VFVDGMRIDEVQCGDDMRLPECNFWYGVNLFLHLFSKNLNKR
jgi:hypothetical protein